MYYFLVLIKLIDMTNFYFVKMFLIDKMLPYTLMTLSASYLLLEVIAPDELKGIIYDFSDRLFFKFIYRPIRNFLRLIKTSILWSVKKVGELFKLSKKLKEKRKEKARIAKLAKARNKEIKKSKKLEKKLEEKALKKEERLQKKFAQAQKRDAKNQVKARKKEIKNQKYEFKMQNKAEIKRLKNEMLYKIKLIIAHKLKKIIQKIQSE